MRLNVAMKLNDTKNFQISDSRCFTEPAFNAATSRMATDYNEYGNHLQSNMGKVSTHKKSQYLNTTHERSIHSPYLGNLSRQMKNERLDTSKLPSVDGLYESQQRMHNSRRHDEDLNSLRKKGEGLSVMTNVLNPKHLPDDKDPLSGNTLLTYEDESLNEEVDPGERINIDNFFKGKSNHDLRKFELENEDDDGEGNEDSDQTEEDMDTDQFDEGYKRIRTFEYNCDTYDDVGEMQKILEMIKKDNIDIKNREKELKEKFENLKIEYERMVKEKANLETRQSALDTREKCFKNERKNLSTEFSNLKNEQEEFKNNIKELDSLKLSLAQVSQEEELKKNQTVLFEAKIKEVSQIIQKENQNLRSLENTMYKTKISNKIEEFTEELQNMNDMQAQINPIQLGINPLEKRRIIDRYSIDEKCNLDLVLVLLRNQSSTQEDELRNRAAHVSQLRDNVTKLKEISST